MSPALQNIITQILIVALPTLTVTFLGWLIPHAIQEWQYLSVKYPQWANLLHEYAPVAVAAAEQLRKSGALQTGAAARNWAITQIQNYLNAHGCAAIPVQLIINDIEAAVLALPEFKPSAQASVVTVSTPGIVPSGTNTPTTTSAPIASGLPATPAASPDPSAKG